MSVDDRAAGQVTGTGLPHEMMFLVARVRQRLESVSKPVFVGIDGRSGAGKSTLAAAVAASVAADDEPTAVTVIDGDDFYSGGSDATWDARTAAEKADRVIDWRRQRAVLERLRVDGVASWHPFDWDAENWDSETVPLAADPNHAQTSRLTILEGAYSCRPELHDLLDLRVLLQVPDDVRAQRLRRREGEEYRIDWAARWSAAEDYYFGQIMSVERFDLVLDGAFP